MEKKAAKERSSRGASLNDVFPLAASAAQSREAKNSRPGSAPHRRELCPDPAPSLAETAVGKTPFRYEATRWLPQFPQTWNRYAYVGGTPLSAVDPLGLCPLPSGSGLVCGMSTVNVSGSYALALVLDGIAGGPDGAQKPGCYVENEDPKGGKGYFVAASYHPGERPRVERVSNPDCFGGGSRTGGGAAWRVGPMPGAPTTAGPSGPVCSTHLLVGLDPNDPGGRFTLASPSVHPWFAPAFATALTEAIHSLNVEGIVPQMNSGFRFSAVQSVLYDGGRGPGAALSLHEAGYAVDIQQKGLIAGTMGSFGFGWGGNFGSPDPVHYYIDPFGPTGSPGYEAALESAVQAAAAFAAACLR